MITPPRTVLLVRHPGLGPLPPYRYRRSCPLRRSQKLHVRSGNLDGFLNKAYKTRLSANGPQNRQPDELVAGFSH
ncbi:MAG: hypothetical protein Q8M37_10575 [Nevskia sp.]|nr:hypothetical protein [Nevskia sp.]